MYIKEASSWRHIGAAEIPAATTADMEDATLADLKRMSPKDIHDVAKTYTTDNEARIVELEDYVYLLKQEAGLSTRELENKVIDNVTQPTLTKLGSVVKSVVPDTSSTLLSTLGFSEVMQDGDNMIILLNAQIDRGSYSSSDFQNWELLWEPLARQA